MQSYHNSFYAMGTRLNAVFAHEDESLCDCVFQLIQSEVLRIEKRLNYYDPASELSKINKISAGKSIQLDDELYSIFKICIEYSELTNYSFDITANKINVQDYSTGYKHITPAEKIELNDNNKTLKFLTEDVKVDSGGFGKGYSLENIKNILSVSQIKNGIISFGGSSIYALGKHPCGSDWKIGINDLYDEQKPAVEIELSNKSISVSGNYFVNDQKQLIGKKHIINPYKGCFNEELKTVIVSSGSPLQAEILSTAFMNMTETEIKNTLQQFEDVNVSTIGYSNQKPQIKKI